MEKNTILYVVIVVLILAGVGGFLFLSTNNANKEIGTTPTSETATTTPVADNTMFDCGLAKDPQCFADRMNGCLPVTVKMMGSDNTTSIELTILGVENDTCHFQRKINNVLDLNCFFPKGTMNWDTIDQTFGNEKGLQKVVDSACKKGW